MYMLFYDSLQEGLWFKNLNQHFQDAELVPIPNKLSQQQQYGLQDILVYDRPDIILKDNNTNIFVLERTKEVPSGHNVGQRFGRLVAAAKNRIPVVYFGPYVAYKHGGQTAGPRYINLRLFDSLQILAQYYDTAVTTINWPVDNNYEVLTTPSKDRKLQEYLDLFFSYYDVYGFSGLTEFIAHSDFQNAQLREQDNFAQNKIRNPEQYDMPPESVCQLNRQQFEQRYGLFPDGYDSITTVYIYNVGMQYIRSDPYTGMTYLYYYLYCVKKQNTCLILSFPNITFEMWNHLSPASKTYRMYKNLCTAIIFSDGIKWQDEI